MASRSVWPCTCAWATPSRCAAASWQYCSATAGSIYCPHRRWRVLGAELCAAGGGCLQHSATLAGSVAVQTAAGGQGRQQRANGRPLRLARCCAGRQQAGGPAPVAASSGSHGVHQGGAGAGATGRVAQRSTEQQELAACSWHEYPPGVGLPADSAAAIVADLLLQVIAGSDKGVVGKVVSVNTKRGEILVEGVNIKVR